MEKADEQTKTGTKDPNLDPYTLTLRKFIFKTLTQKTTIDVLKFLTTLQFQIIVGVLIKGSEKCSLIQL